MTISSHLIQTIIRMIAIPCGILLICCYVACSTVKTSDNNTVNETATANDYDDPDKYCMGIQDYPKLSQDSPDNFEFDYTPGKDTAILKKNCYAYYREYWQRQVKKDKYMETSDAPFFIKIRKIIADPASDIKVKLNNGDVAIIKRTGWGLDIDDTPTVEDIWVFRAGRWEHQTGCEDNNYRTVQLLNLNNDDYIDAIVKGGCCDSSSLDIFIGDKEKTLIHRQGIGILGMWKFRYNGKCSNRIDVEPYPAMVEEHGQRPMSAEFDCVTNGFRIVSK